LKGRVRVTFVDEYGMEEAGVDGGGLFKEFAEAVVKAAFAPSAGLFVETPARELAPAPAAGASPASRAALTFVGRFLGRLLAAGILVELPLARFAVKLLLGRPVGLADLPSLDPQLAAGLTSLLAVAPGDVEGLGLVFALPASDAPGAPDLPLLPGGAARPVTPSNRVEFAHRAARFYMGRCGRAAACLRAGLADAVPSGWWPRAFSAAEFGALLGGAPAPVDVDDMAAHATYGGGYDAGSEPVAALWGALRSMTAAERGAVLRFVTACSRPPLLGFGALAPPLCVSRAGDDPGRLPSAATCANLLKLPPYRTAEEAKSKLLLAAAEAGGCGLS
jgi:ubiquitin-protein ligase E3 C